MKTEDGFPQTIVGIEGISSPDAMGPSFSTEKERPIGGSSLFESRTVPSLFPERPSYRVCSKEGLEETLMLHCLGLFDELGKSLKTTNCIESLMGDVEEHTRKVKRWHHSPQRHQWMALAVLEAENGFRRLDGYEDLPRLQAALKETIPDEE